MGMKMLATLSFLHD